MNNRTYVTMGFKNLIILAFTISITDLYAQPDFKPGYVILNSHDTIYGKIDSRGDNFQSHSCRFKSIDSGSLTTYSPKDILEYRFFYGKCYTTKILESGKAIFLEYLIKGKLNVYYYQDDDGNNNYFIDKNNLPLRLIPYKEEIRFRDDGTPVLYQSTYHIGLLNAYTSDAENFKSEPINIDKPEHKKLVRFARDYHNAVCKDEQCIIYEKSVPFLKTSLEMLYGQTLINRKEYSELITNTPGLNSVSNSSEVGLGLYFWMPRASERIYFRTGIRFCQVNFKDEKLNYKIIPAHIQYQYSHFKVIPKIFFGFNNYFFKDKSFFWTIAPGIGADYRLLKRFSITSNFATEFEPVTIKLLFNPESESISFLSYSLHIGLKIDL